MTVRITQLVAAPLVAFGLFLASCSEAETQHSAAKPEITASGSADLARLAERAEGITILRDDYGVPHIYAQTDADAVFGMLYAHAEDDFPRIERNYIWAIGRLAEIKGESALYSDLRARLYMTRAEALDAYNRAPDWLKALCDAWADGLNYYLATHPEVEPALLTRFEPWMPMYFSEGSIGGDIEGIDLAGIEAFYGAGADTPTAANGLIEERPTGSNGFAISGDHTKSGKAMLLINPHTSFYFRGEVHVVSEEGLNAYGASTWGQFFVYQGFNEYNGWMHTSTYVDFKDEFIEDVIEEDGQYSYRYGQEVRPVRETPVTLTVKTDSGFEDRSFTMYHTHHGPITHKLDGKWVATKINWDPVNALQQSFIRTKTRSHAEFRAMMDIRTNSSNNTVYADRDGTTAYYHGNFIPKRDPSFDYSKPVDGSTPATDWQGLHSVDEIITVVNPAVGWIQNTNSTPFTSAGADSPKREDYPVYMAPDPQNFRALHAVKVLEGVSDLTLDGLIELAHDPYLPGMEALIPGLIKAYDGANGSMDPSLAPAIDLLRGWDYRVAGDSIAMTLAHFYGTAMNATASAPEGLSRMERVIYYGTKAPDTLKLGVFSRVVAKLTEDFGDWRQPWSAVNRFQRLNGDIEQYFDDSAPSVGVPMAAGSWGALASYGVRQTGGTAKLYGAYGNSFVAVVEFGDKVRAKSMLVGGQNGNPASPHFADQVQPYIDRAFKTVPYYRDDVEARAVETYHPGQR